MITKSVIFYLDREVNAMLTTKGGGHKHVHIAAGAYTTEDREIQRFLANYEGVSVQDVKAVAPPSPIQFGQFGARPQQVKVLSGGISGGGAQNAKQKAQRPGDVSN